MTNLIYSAMIVSKLVTNSWDSVQPWHMTQFGAVDDNGAFTTTEEVRSNRVAMVTAGGETFEHELESKLIMARQRRWHYEHTRVYDGTNEQWVVFGATLTNVVFTNVVFVHGSFGGGEGGQLVGITGVKTNSPSNSRTNGNPAKHPDWLWWQGGKWHERKVEK